MKFKELVTNNLIKDNDRITVAMPMTGSACDIRKGNWFNDQMLEFMDAEIKAFSWNEDNGYSIALKGI